MRTRLLAALATPQVLVALLLAIGGLALLLGAPRTPVVESVVIELGAAEQVLREQDAAFVVVDELGLERVAVERLPLPENQGERLGVVLERLRELAIQQGVWPQELPAPQVFVVQNPGGPVAVVNVSVPQPVGVSVEQESALARALAATVQRNGVAQVRFLRNGRPTDTLLGHVAVASEL